MIRDEQDVLPGLIKHMVGEGFDGLLIADNRSTDQTYAKLRDAANLFGRDCKIEIIYDNEVGYYQSRKMTALAERAHHEFGAEWIVPFDADEIWYSRGDRVAVDLRNQPQHVSIVLAELWNHFTTDLDDKTTIDPFRRIQYRQSQPGQLPKVAVRWEPGSVIDMGNHGARVMSDGITAYGLELRHFPYRSKEQFVKKAKNGAEAYKATDLPEHFGAHWRQYGQLLEQNGPAALEEVYETYFHFKIPALEGMVLDPAPYCRFK